MSQQYQGSPDIARIEFQINQTDLLAGTIQRFVAPQDGFIRGLYINTQVVVGTGGTLKVRSKAAEFNPVTGLNMQNFKGTITGQTLIAGSGSVADVTGAVITVPNSQAVGTTQNAIATQDATTPVKKGQEVQIVPAGFATSGAVNGFIEFQNASLSKMS